MKPLQILLVEDNDGDIYLTKEALNEGKIPKEITVAKDGYKALQYLEDKGGLHKEKDPDIILLDVNLPKMNGHELLKTIKNHEKLKHIPVVMLSTSSSEGDIIRSYENHANCYITKPIDLNDFFEVIQSIEDFWILTAQLPNKVKDGDFW